MKKIEFTDNQKEVVKKFDLDIKECLFLLKKNQEEARDFFNSEIYFKYKDYIFNSDGFMSKFQLSIIEMDEYFNNEGAKVAMLYSTEKNFILNIDKEEEYVSAIKEFFE